MNTNAQTNLNRIHENFLQKNFCNEINSSKNQSNSISDCSIRKFCFFAFYSTSIGSPGLKLIKLYQEYSLLWTLDYTDINDHKIDNVALIYKSIKTVKKLYQPSIIFLTGNRAKFYGDVDVELVVLLVYQTLLKLVHKNIVLLFACAFIFWHEEEKYVEHPTCLRTCISTFESISVCDFKVQYEGYEGIKIRICRLGAIT